MKIAIGRGTLKGLGQCGILSLKFMTAANDKPWKSHWVNMVVLTNFENEGILTQRRMMTIMQLV